MKKANVIVGMGGLLVLAGIVAAGYWFMSRPKPLKACNSLAIVATDAPRFAVSLQRSPKTGQ